MIRVPDSHNLNRLPRHLESLIRTLFLALKDGVYTLSSFILTEQRSFLFLRQSGLASVPAIFHPLRECIGLAGQGWDDLGKPWHDLASLWLRAEQIVVKTGQSDVAYDEIMSSAIPQGLKNWMIYRKLQQDCPAPAETFGNEFTRYLDGLQWEVITKGDGVLQHIWCRPGKTGIVVLLVGLYWQAIYSGSGKKWASNVKHVDAIFRAIIAAPSLYATYIFSACASLTDSPRQSAKRRQVEIHGAESTSPAKRARK